MPWHLTYVTLGHLCSRCRVDTLISPCKTFRLELAGRHEACFFTHPLNNDVHQIEPGLRVEHSIQTCVR